MVHFLNFHRACLHPRGAFHAEPRLPQSLSYASRRVMLPAVLSSERGLRTQVRVGRHLPGRECKWQETLIIALRLLFFHIIIVITIIFNCCIGCCLSYLRPSRDSLFWIDPCFFVSILYCVFVAVSDFLCSLTSQSTIVKRELTSTFIYIYVTGQEGFCALFWFSIFVFCFPHSYDTMNLEWRSTRITY